VIAVAMLVLVVSASSALIRAALQDGHGPALDTKSYVVEALAVLYLMLAAIALVFF